MREKHLQCYYNGFAIKLNAGQDTMKLIEIFVAETVGRQWLYKELIT